MPDYSKQTVPSLRIELKHRNLPQTGTKKLLIARLKATDDLPLTPEERDVYHTQLKIEHEAACLQEIKEIPQFAELPREIREMIWWLSLPGPRVLRWGRLCEMRLCLTREGGGGSGGQPPNPAMLGVCKESRAVALKRYRLCFWNGTGGVYVDLEGGDVLFMDGGDLPPWEWVHYPTRPIAGGKVEVTGEKQQMELSPSVQTDLKKVKHILLSWLCWNRYENGHDSGGSVLRHSLEKYSSLERVSLSDDFGTQISSVFAGYYELDDPGFKGEPREMGDGKKRGSAYEWPREWEGSGSGSIGVQELEKWKVGHEYARGHYRALRLMRGWDLDRLGEVDREEGIPECRFVRVGKVLDMPRRVVEERKRELGSDDEELVLEVDVGY